MSFNPRSTDDPYPHHPFWKSSLRNELGEYVDIPNVTASGRALLQDKGLNRTTLLLGHFLLFDMDTTMFEDFLADVGLDANDCRTIAQNLSLWCENCL